MDLAPMKDGLSAVAILISLGGIVYAWVTSRSRVNAEHLVLVDEKIAEHRSRLERIETTLSHTPGEGRHHRDQAGDGRTPRKVRSAR